MTQYVVAADGWRRPTAWTETFPREMKNWKDYVKGDVVDLDPENDEDAIDIQRLATGFRPALVEKEQFDRVSEAQRNAALAVAAARAAALTPTQPIETAIPGASGEDEGTGPFKEGSSTQSAGSTVGSGGTDPEPGGFTGESDGRSYDDADAWPYAELQSAARDRGLSAGGSRVDLVERIRAFDRAQGDPLSKAAASGELDDEEKAIALRGDGSDLR